MIERIIEFSARNRFIVLTLIAATMIGAVWCLKRIPLAAANLGRAQVMTWNETRTAWAQFEAARRAIFMGAVTYETGEARVHALGHQLGLPPEKVGELLAEAWREWERRTSSAMCARLLAKPAESDRPQGWTRISDEEGW
mgnify:CR=1 FL=1